MTFLLPYRPPYHWPAMLAFLAARAVPATEQVTGDGWHRSLRVQWSAPAGRVDDGHDATTDAGAAVLIVSVHDEPERQALRVDLSAPLPEHAAARLSVRLAAMFDVTCDPQAVQAALGDLAAAEPGLRLPGSMDSFELVVRAILGQQVTVAAARTLASRLVARYGTPLPSASAAALPGLSHLFPTPATMAAADPAALGELGIIRARGAAIIATAAALEDGRLQLEPGAAVEPALAALTAIRGIGPWTAHYVAMRTLGWRDAFPPGDVVVLKALQAGSAAEAARRAQAWRPWRAYALLHLWRRSAATRVLGRSA